MPGDILPFFVDAHNTPTTLARSIIADDTMATAAEIKSRLLPVLRQFYHQDMRYSYYVAAGLIVLGTILNIVLAHGWTVWPFVFIASLLSMIHETADRNGQGVPPLMVYALFIGGLALWVAVGFLFSLTNPLVLLIGAIAITYQCAKGYMQELQRTALIQHRRANQLCIHCGEPFKPNELECSNCGGEPNPEGARLNRVAAVVHNRKNTPKARSTIKGQSPTASAAAREQALIARHHAGQSRRH